MEITVGFYGWISDLLHQKGNTCYIFFLISLQIIISIYKCIKNLFQNKLEIEASIATLRYTSGTGYHHLRLSSLIKGWRIMIRNSWNIISNLYGNIHFFPMISVTGMVAGFDWNIDQMVSSGEVLVSTLIHDTNGGRVQPPFVFKK